LAWFIELELCSALRMRAKQRSMSSAVTRRAGLVPITGMIQTPATLA
jgi:hypothetical protein